MLSVVLTRPDLFDRLTRRVGPDDFTTPRLRRVFEHLRDVADEHGTPAYDLLMSGTDDESLKQLLVGLDADARRRDLPGLLGGAPGLSGGADPRDGAADGRDAAPVGTAPRVFDDVVQRLIDRRTQQQWQRSYGQVVRRLAAGPPDEDAKEQLRRLQQQLAARHAP